MSFGGTPYSSQFLVQLVSVLPSVAWMHRYTATSRSSAKSVSSHSRLGDPDTPLSATVAPRFILFATVSCPSLTISSCDVDEVELELAVFNATTSPVRTLSSWSLSN